MPISCPFCKKHFNSQSGLANHLLLHVPCHRLLLGQVPPIPAHVHRDITSAQGGGGPTLFRRSNRLLRDEPEMNQFPDHLSAINNLQPPQPNSLTDCCLYPSNIFQLPSELIEKVKHIGLNLDDSSFGEDIRDVEVDPNNHSMNPNQPPGIPPHLLLL
jgi:hypothetical protein